MPGIRSGIWSQLHTIPTDLSIKRLEGTCRCTNTLQTLVQRKMFNFDQDQGSGPMLEKLRNQCLIEGPLKTGTTVQVKGVPQIDQRASEIIHSTIEIKAFAVRTVNDPNDEIDRMILVDKLKRSEIYSQLFQAS